MRPSRPRGPGEHGRGFGWSSPPRRTLAQQARRRRYRDQDAIEDSVARTRNGEQLVQEAGQVMVRLVRSSRTSTA